MDVGGGTHRYSYEGRNGWPSEVTDPAGNTWGYRHDSFGNVISVSDPDGVQVTITRNNDGLITRIANIAADHSEIVVRKCEYDQVGRVIADTDLFGSRTTYDYDEYGNLKSEQRPGEYLRTFSYTRAGRLTSDSGDPNAARVAYDSSGEVESVETISGGITRFSHDPYGRPIERIEPGGEILRREVNNLGQTISVSDETGCAITASYDRDGNVVRLTDRDGYTQDFEYDKLRRTTQATGPGRQSKSYTYNPNGKPETITSEAGTTRSFEYDPCGRLVKEVDPDGGETCFS